MRPRIGSALLFALLAAAPAWAQESINAQDYNAAGRGINTNLDALKKAFVEFCDPELIEGVLEPGYASKVRSVREHTKPELPSKVQWRRLSPGPALGNDAAAVAEAWGLRRAGFATVDGATFRLLEIDEIREDGAVHARWRYEVVGEGREGGRRVERALLSGVWRKVGERYRLSDHKLARGELLYGAGQAFVECATERGLRSYGVEDPRYVPPSDALRYQVIRHAIGGAAAADVNGDGWDDVLFTTGDRVALFLNERGRFRDVTAEWGLGAVRHANAPLFADFDNDGDADLYLGRFYGQNLLFENNGRTLRDVTAGSGLAQDDMTAVLVSADFNGDGFLDLYLGRFLDARTEVPDMILYSRNGAPNKLYFGGGDLTFQDRSAGSGAEDVGLTLGAGAADFDRDGDQDLYLSNDYGRNVFLRNRGDGTFEDATLRTDTLAISGGMSVSWGDVDNDGGLDLYVSSIGSNQRWFSQDLNIRSYVLNIVQSQRRERLQDLFLDLRKHMGEDWDQVGDQSLAGNYLLHQSGDGSFDDWSERAGVRPQGWYWSSGFFDVDLDGNLDIYAVNGWITGELKDDL